MCQSIFLIPRLILSGEPKENGALNTTVEFTDTALDWTRQPTCQERREEEGRSNTSAIYLSNLLKSEKEVSVTFTTSLAVALDKFS